jgi:hypothetical protein
MDTEISIESTKARIYGPSREINKENATREIDLLNKIKSLSAEEKYEIVLSRSDEEIAKIIIKNNINSWKEFEKEFTKMIIDGDKIVEVCAKRRMNFENQIDFGRRIKKELEQLNISERAIIKHLAVNIWPGRNDVAVLLTSHVTFDEFEAHVNQISENDRKGAAKRRNQDKKSNN